MFEILQWLYEPGKFRALSRNGALASKLASLTVVLSFQSRQTFSQETSIAYRVWEKFLKNIEEWKCSSIF